MRKSISFFAAVVFLSISMSCEDMILSVEDRAKQASTEFCECMKKNSLSTCEDKLNSKYGHYSNNNDFIKAFNSVNSCGATVYKK